MMLRAVSRCAAAGLLALSGAVISAQGVPTDNDQWRERCSRLVASGAVPAPDGSGIAPQRLEQLALDLSEQGQHFVACSLLMMAAGDQAAGSNGQPSRDDVLLAKIEMKLGLGAKLSFADKLSRAAGILAHLQGDTPPSQPEVSAMTMMLQAGGAAPAAGYGPAAATGYAAVPYAARAGDYAAAQGDSRPPIPQNAPFADRPSAVAAVAYAPAADPLQARPPAATEPYKPLALGDNLASNTARQQWIMSHVTAAGTPAACRHDWQTDRSSPLNCAAAFDQQAQAEMAAGNYNAALEDYDNAKLAAATAGTWNSEMAGQMPHRTQIQRALDPPKANAAYGRAGVVPAGHYLCFQAAVVIANGTGNADLTVQSPQQDGEMWVFDATHYAGFGGGKGSYHMNGNQMVAESGPYADSPSHDPTRMTYIAKGPFNRPTVRLDFYNPATGKEEAATNCEWNDKN